MWNSRSKGLEAGEGREAGRWSGGAGARDPRSLSPATSADRHGWVCLTARGRIEHMFDTIAARVPKGPTRGAALPLGVQLPRRGLPPRGAGRRGGEARSGRARPHRPRRALRRGAVRVGCRRVWGRHRLRGRADRRRGDRPNRRGGPVRDTSGDSRERPGRIFVALPRHLGGPAQGREEPPCAHHAASRRSRICRSCRALDGAHRLPQGRSAEGRSNRKGPRLLHAGWPPSSTSSGEKTSPSSCGTTANRWTPPATTPWPRSACGRE
ncbi:MAG: hypothetical protein KatS3mg008_2258 [Acidimicrobiales bacterium]|nr:MAG: hypothetical protein KatS3mg008_2258 [Acidimicrobiales bacterium]